MATTTKTLKFSISGSKSITFTGTGSITATYVYETNTYATIQSVNNSTFSGNSGSGTATGTKTGTLPSSLANLTKVTYSVTGAPSSLSISGVGSSLTLNTSGTTSSSSLVSFFNNAGAGTTLTATASKNVTVYSGYGDFSLGNWSPQSYTNPSDKTSGSTETKKATASKSMTKTGSFSSTVTFILTFTTPEEGGGDSGETGGETGGDEPTSNAIFNIETGGVAIGQLCTGVSTDKKFQINMPTTFDQSTQMMKVEMSDGWHPLTLASGVTASTTKVGTYNSGTADTYTGGAAYRVEGKHKVTIVANVNFTPSTTDNVTLATGIPEAYRPSRHVYGICCADVDNLGIMRIGVSPAGNVYCGWAVVLGTKTSTARTYTDINFSYFI